MIFTSDSGTVPECSSVSMAQGTVMKRIRRSKRTDQFSIYQRSSSILFFILVSPR